MQPAASPRHPWKALAAIIAMFAVVHGAGAHVFSHDHERDHDHGHSIVTIGHAGQFDDDCPDVHVRVFDDGPEDTDDDDHDHDDAWDEPATDPFDHDFD